MHNNIQQHTNFGQDTVSFEETIKKDVPAKEKSFIQKSINYLQDFSQARYKKRSEEIDKIHQRIEEIYKSAGW